MKRTSCSSRATSLLVVTVLLALAAPNARPVDLGDAAPAINASEWIKDSPVTVAPGGKILVIDFWNTTAPCRYTVPYVNNLQKQFSNRGVQFVGITSESSAKARKFLDSLGTPIEYPMAIDKGTATSRAYLSGMSGELPHAFVISPERKIVWHGNATVALEQVLNEVIAGKFTAESAKRTITAEQLMRDYFKQAYGGTNGARMAELGGQILSNASGYASLLNEFAWKILTDRRIKTADRDSQLALRASEAAYHLSGEGTVPIMDTYARALFAAGKPQEAIAMEEKAIAACKDAYYRPELESVRLRFIRLSHTNSVPK